MTFTIWAAALLALLLVGVPFAVWLVYVLDDDNDPGQVHGFDC